LNYWNCYENEKQKYHTVGTGPKSIRTIVEKG